MLVRFEDWLYDKKQEKDLKAIAGKDALRYLKEKNEEER